MRSARRRGPGRSVPPSLPCWSSRRSGQASSQPRVACRGAEKDSSERSEESSSVGADFLALLSEPADLDKPALAHTSLAAAPPILVGVRASKSSLRAELQRSSTSIRAAAAARRRREGTLLGKSWTPGGRLVRRFRYGCPLLSAGSPLILCAHPRTACTAISCK